MEKERGALSRRHGIFVHDQRGSGIGYRKLHLNGYQQRGKCGEHSGCVNGDSGASCPEHHHTTCVGLRSCRADRYLQRSCNRNRTACLSVVCWQHRNFRRNLIKLCIAECANSKRGNLHGCRVQWYFTKRYKQRRCARGKFGGGGAKHNCAAKIRFNNSGAKRYLYRNGNRNGAAFVSVVFGRNSYFRGHIVKLFNSECPGSQCGNLHRYRIQRHLAKCNKQRRSTCCKSPSCCSEYCNPTAHTNRNSRTKRNFHRGCNRNRTACLSVVSRRCRNFGRNFGKLCHNQRPVCQCGNLHRYRIQRHFA